MFALNTAILLIVTAMQLPLDPSHRIEPVATRDAYMDFCRSIGVQSEQIQIADFLYEDYIDSLLEIQADSINRAVSAGSEQLDAVLQGRSSISPSKLAELRLKVLRTREANWLASDNLFDNLVEGTEAFGSSNAGGAVPAPAMDFRRRIVLEHARSKSSDPAYAGEGFDMAFIIEREKDLLLSGVDSEELSAIIQTWRERAAQLIAMHATANRKASLEARATSITRDAEESGRLMREHIARWKPLHELNQWAVEAIASSLGDPVVAAAWRTRIRQEQFPWLHDQDSTELLSLWIVKNSQAAQQAEANAILESYLQERDIVRRRAEELLLSARLEEGIVLGSRLAEQDPAAAEARRRWLQGSGELESLKERTGGRLEALLTPGQRAAAWRSIRER